MTTPRGARASWMLASRSAGSPRWSRTCTRMAVETSAVGSSPAEDLEVRLLGGLPREPGHPGHVLVLMAVQPVDLLGREIHGTVEAAALPAAMVGEEHPPVRVAGQESAMGPEGQGFGSGPGPDGRDGGRERRAADRALVPVQVAAGDHSKRITRRRRRAMVIRLCPTERRFFTLMEVDPLRS